MTKPTTIYEDNQAALDIMVIGHIAIRVKHIAVPMVIIHEDIKIEMQDDRRYQENSIQYPAEPGLFVFYNGLATLIVVILTDDFLSVYSHEELCSSLKTHMEICVPVATQEGNSLKYRNVQLIQKH
jgi:hypothetical protein